MSTYQDVVNADLPLGAWALTEAAGTDFVPYTGPYHLLGAGAFLYRQSGPFGTALAVHLAVGASLHTVSLPFPNSGGFAEVWMKLDAFPPATTVAVMYWGNSGANGNGVVMLTTGQLQLFAPGGATINTGFFIADANWHLYQFGNPSLAGGSALAVDGKLVYAVTPGVGGSVGNPNQMGFGSTSVSGAAVAMKLAYPAVYATPLTQQIAYSHFLASTAPDTAIGFTLTGQAGSSALLSQILASVRKTYVAP